MWKIFAPSKTKGHEGAWRPTKVQTGIWNGEIDYTCHLLFGSFFKPRKGAKEGEGDGGRALKERALCDHHFCLFPFSISFGSIPYRPASFIILLSSLGCACLSMVALLIPFTSYIFKLMHSFCLFLDPWIGCSRHLLASFWTFWVLGAQFLISVDLVCHAVVATLCFRRHFGRATTVLPVHSCGRDLAQHRWAPLRLKGSQSPRTVPHTLTCNIDVI